MQSERLPLPRIKGLMSQVAAALIYAHGRAIVHRDIKPDNIMVVGDDHVKVTDFGIARILRSGGTLNTATGTSIGTPLYMAPEQIEGTRIDGRADIYSLGTVMYHLVTGHPPFEGQDPLTVAFKHVHRPPQPPRELNADVPSPRLSMRRPVQVRATQPQHHPRAPPQTVSRRRARARLR
jgi:serine/threonine-protein kinase